MLRRLVTVAVAAALALAAVGCGATQPAASGGAGADPAAPLRVVASTNVWGAIAADIGGSAVSVTSLIDDPSQDPHEFQPSGRDELAVARAAVVIGNGGGYDDFLGQMLSSVGHRPTVVTATDVAAHLPSIQRDNEHVWLDPDAAIAVADAVADAFAGRDPSHAAAFHAAAAAFAASLAPVRAHLTELARRFRGTPIAVTEPLPLYLTAAAGLDNVTPPSFTDAVEEGVDVSPADMSTVLALFTHHRVELLAYNEQAASAQAEQVLAAAETNRVPVLALTELLPAGETYTGWMTSLTDTLGRLLAEADAR